MCAHGEGKQAVGLQLPLCIAARRWRVITVTRDINWLGCSFQPQHVWVEQGKHQTRNRNT